MTIAAGFKCMDGVLLCADSQFTIADKSFREKIITRAIGPAKFAFALCGDEDYALSAIEDCCYALDALEATKYNVKSFRETISSCISSASKSYDRHKGPSDQKPEFLVAISMPEQNVQLFSARESAMPPVSMCKVIGTGGYIARYIDRAFGLMSRQSIKDSIFMALYFVAAAKRHDAYCGGGSQFFVIRPGWAVGQFNYDWSAADDCLVELDRTWGNLLSVMGDPSSAHFDIKMRSFQFNMERIRGKFFEENGSFWCLLRSMGINPESPPNLR